MVETWLPIPGYEGLYEVSDHGRVRSLDRLRVNGSPIPGRIHSPYDTQNGYLAIKLSSAQGKRSSVNLHSIVTAAFFGPKPEGMWVRHLNDIKHDNRITNLAYGTPPENAVDAVTNGRNYKAKQTHCHVGHEYSPENTAIRIWPDGHCTRACRACKREADRRRRETV